MNKSVIVFAIVLLSFVGTAFSQSADELNKLRIAQALEQAGEFEKALDFYKQLYDSSPGNYVYFDGLRRAYMNLKDYPAAETLIQKRLAVEPQNVTLYCELGDAYFKAGASDSAITVWNKALEIDPKNSGTYQAVADIMAQNRLFDGAIEVYRRGERTTDSKSGFIVQIARLYFLKMNYRESLRELLKLFQSDNKNSAMAYIQSQLGAYSASREAVDRFTEEMKDQVRYNSDNVYYRQILAFLYMEQKSYSAAYDVYKWLDERSGSNGMQLLAFAERAYYDEAYQVAANAYQEVSRLSKAEPVIAESIMGYANSLRRLGGKDYSEDDRPCAVDDPLKDLNASLAAYMQVIEQYPEPQYFSPAVLSSIEIRMNYFHDTKSSEKLFSEYGKFSPAYAQQATLTRIELYMMEGRFSDALTASVAGIGGGAAIGSLPDAQSNYADRLRYEAARALYYLGNFDSASYFLNKIISNPMSDAANEAIQLSDIIANNKAIAGALKEYASANAMEVADRIPEATAQYEDIVKSFPQAPLAANARFDLAAAYCRMGKVNDALKYYLSLAEDSTGIFADRSQLRIARIYQVTLHDTSKAVSEYEKFLVRFPNSIYQDKVRGILRDLLGNNS